MYRVGLPMAALGDRGHEVRLWDLGQGGPPGPEVYAGVDIVYLKRQRNANLFRLLELLPGKRPKVVVDFDDLSWRIPEWHPKQYQISGKDRDGIMEVARLADALTVTTPELAEEARVLNPQVYVCPNSIDYQYRDWETRDRLKVLEGHLTIGWAGGDRSARDMEVIGPALREVLNDHRHVTLVLAGGEECLRDWLRATGADKKRCALLPPVDFESYPKLLTNIDIGLAPLASNEFNRCKSPIKLLEYGAWGIPYIASNVGPYRRFHAETFQFCGDLAQTPGHWKVLLDDMITVSEHRRRLGVGARKIIRERYSLEVAAAKWEAAFLEVCGEGQDKRGATRSDSRSNVHSLV